MKEVKGGVFSPRDFKLVRKIILQTLNPDVADELTSRDKTDLKALYHRLGRSNES